MRPTHQVELELWRKACLRKEFYIYDNTIGCDICSGSKQYLDNQYTVWICVDHARKMGLVW